MAAEAPAADLGWAALPFTLRGCDGHLHALADLAGPRGTVVAFICNHCPYVRAILPRLVRDARELRTLGVHVIGINANDDRVYPEDSYECMVALAPSLPFAYLHDKTQEVARAWDAVCTPDFYGFDAQLKLRYRGRLDASRKEAAPADAPRELYEAMCLVAETGRGPALQHPCLGCSIKWRDAD